MAHASNQFDAPQPPGKTVRVVVSLLVMLHVAAVFTGPWMMQGSELSLTVGRVLRPYIEVLNLANGYRFFAPEPGPSHLIRYEVTQADGRQVQGVFPDRQVYRPRLLYHRYFMMSEFINTLSNPDAPKETVEAYAQSYAKHLLKEYNGTSVKLFLVRHYVPRMAEVRRGLPLADKSLYEERILVSYEPDES